ncbi:hypothetical protein D3C84_941240 [compost metagenome]
MGRFSERVDDLANIITRRIIANDDLDVFVSLGQGTEQRLVEEPRVVGGDNDTDERK